MTLEVIFFICCVCYGIASINYDYGHGIIRFEDGKFVKYLGKPNPEAIILYRPLIFVSGIGGMIYEILALVSILAVISIFAASLWKLEWYFPLTGFILLIPIGKSIGKPLIKCPIGGIIAPLFSLLVVVLTSFFIFLLF
jgi:hypothetical protein